MIKPDFIERLKDQLDIVQVISQFIPLKKAGSSHKGCCPFHNEKSPSFNVNSTRRTYKCFGCGAGGDAIKFVMSYKNLTYPEAIEYLAQSYNLLVEYDTPNRPNSRFKGFNIR